ncbi:MAG: hypothetical protein EP335_10525 [Alphaproteobacteria bacterium]|nr:MAG: hypothetical protein EP335_10525 [Alphaproteobacteria bacterium]
MIPQRNVAPEPVVTLPVVLEHNRAVTTLSVGGKPLSLLLDTGASKTLLLNSEGLGNAVTDGAAPVNIHFPAFDQVATGLQVGAIDFRSGDFTYTSENTLLLPDNAALVQRLATKMDGILGRDFFSAFVVAVSPGDGTVRLYPAGTDMSQLYDTSYAITMKNGSPYLVHRSRMPWEDWSTTKTFLLDTGYPGGLALWDDDHFVRATNKDEAAALKAAHKGILYFGRMQFGQLVFRNLPVFVGANSPTQLEERHGIIGATMLAPFDYAVDLSSGRLWLSPNMAGLYTGFKFLNSEVYTPGDEDFVLKDFHPPTATAPVTTIYGSEGRIQ